MSAPQTGSMVGRRVGRYRVSRHLASGGMGAVYEVIQDSIGHRAAMKVLPAGLSSDPRHQKYVDRFLDEARAVNLINHPGVLQIFDFGEMEDRTVYILMEYVDGKPLSDYLSQFRSGSVKRMPIFQTAQIIRQIAAVLQVAHGKGVLHRDIKPSNIMLLTETGYSGGVRVKVIDFGLAKFLDTPERRTTAGMTVGTVTYMSPEQCLGDSNLTEKVDVYALGAMLYELLSGEPPFQGEAGAVMRKHVNEVPRPISEVAGQVPAAMQVLLSQMLEKKPDARPTMGQIEARLIEMEKKGELPVGGVAYLPNSAVQSIDVGAPTMPAAALSAPANTRTESVKAQPGSPDRRLAAALLIVGMILGAVGGATLLGRKPTPAPVVAAPVPPCPQPNEGHPPQDQAQPTNNKAENGPARELAAEKTIAAKETPAEAPTSAGKSKKKRK